MNILFKSIIIVIIAFTYVKLTKIIINKVIKITKFNEQKEKTIKSVVVSVSYYLAFTVAIVAILRESNLLGIDRKTILTGAGVIGIVVGIASQNFLKDITNGFFILFENQIKVGDYVTINDSYMGHVEEIGLRSTSIREWNLTKITISNGDIKVIKNYNCRKIRVIIDVCVAFEMETSIVIEALDEVCRILNAKYEEFIYIIDNSREKSYFSTYGVTDINTQKVGAQYTISGVITSEHYWAARKEARLQILNVFRERNIKIAYPKRVIFNNHS